MVAFLCVITGLTKENKQEDVNRFLKEKYDISHTIPAVFLDNFPDWEDPTEKEMTNKELETLKDLASAMPLFSCEDAEVNILNIKLDLSIS